MKKPSLSPEPDRKFMKPSEMKRTKESSQFGSPSSNISNGPMAKTNKPPAPSPAVSDSKPPIPDYKSAASKVVKPPPAPKTARISDLMKRFEKSPGPEQSSPSQSPSPKHDITSPAHKSGLAPPKKVEPDVSPVSGRRFHKRESLGDLKKKFEEHSGGGISDRSTSPSSREGSRGTSPDGGKPFIPPKFGGSTNAQPPWMKNRGNEEKPVPSKPFGRVPSPQPVQPPKPTPEPSPSPGRPLPPWKKEPARPVPEPSSSPGRPPAMWKKEPAMPPEQQQQQPVTKTSPKVGRRFPPPAGPPPPEPPAESEKIEEDTSESKQAFVYR